MSSEAASLLSRARDWASWDPNPTTRASVLSLVAAADLDALRPLFSPPGARLSFGTAGLRAPLRPGPRGMNDLTVVQTSQGLAAHLRATYPGCRLRAAVGRDHRARAKWGLSSARFGRLTAEVFRRSGIFEDVVLLDGTVPTPLVPFAVGRLSETENDLLPTTANGGAGPVRTVGVMITASHNPAEDDGYKLYWTNGCQIVPPVDAQVAAAILQNLTPWRDDYGTDADAPDERDVRLTGRLADLYFRAMAPLRTGSYARHYGSYVPNGPTPPPPVFVYTAMHGVGAPWTARSFRAFGLPPFAEVPSQCAPDPAFPTVPFPNPEERGALDRAIARAREVLGNGASRSQTHAVILANDPDADRLAVAEYSAAEDQTTAFTGDQIGVLLGHWLWTTQKKQSSRPAAMVVSLVSSRMLSAIGAAEGFSVHETPTGFKYIGSRSLELREEGSRVLFSTEEALGYCCGDVVPDKDGVSAAAVLAELAADVYAQGGTLRSRLRALHDAYGAFVSRNGYYFCHCPPTIRAILAHLRQEGAYFSRIGPYQVTAVRDLGSPGYDSSTPDRKPLLPTSASSPTITFELANGCVAHFRASGTEPKFKYYIEMRGKPGVAPETVEEELEEVAEVLIEELLQPETHELVKPAP